MVSSAKGTCNCYKHQTCSSSDQQNTEDRHMKDLLFAHTYNKCIR